MFGAIFLIILLFAISIPILGTLRRKFPWLPVGLLQNLYWYHTAFAIIYYVFTRNANTDSVAYYTMASKYYSNWMDAYETGTIFIHFMSYPFVKFLGFSYEMMMVLFSWFGYWGFVYFYVIFKENIQFKHKLFGIDLITLFVFLPNMHYWTASLGKGSIIFLGIAMAVYGVSQLTTLSTRISPEYVSWRYERNPLFRYHYFTDHTNFLIISRMKKHSFGCELRLVEFFLLNGNANPQTVGKEAKRQVMEYCKVNKVDFISLSGLQCSLYKDCCTWMGFVPIRSMGPSITLRDLNMNSSFQELLTMKNWAFSLGDLELF